MKNPFEKIELNKDDERKIYLVLEWADEHPEFDSTFISSLEDAFLRWHKLTDRQRSALDNIIEKFGIGEDE